MFSPQSPDPLLFPLLYQEHHRSYLQDIPFWLALAKRHPGPILELGCGTGRLTLPLARAGHSVLGLDRDAGMLAILSHQLPPALNGRLHILQADMASFGFGQRFSLILLPCNTFSTLDPHARRSCLEHVLFHLQPGGVFATSIPNPQQIACFEERGQSEMEAIFSHPRSGNPVQAGCTWVKAQGRLTLEWHYDHLLPDGSVERLAVSTVHYLTTVESYRQEMRALGFSDLQVLGDFDAAPYTPTSQHLIMIARKPKGSS